MSLGLPPLSLSLKSIAPYLQRAEELVDPEPVVAYWCAYYAAQLGISLKAQDANSRKLLLNLLDALERLKKEIGPSDTIDIEPASAAYVENFALRVFKSADDEDRSGNASKSTAKKFLAAANFFEVLRVFPKTDVSESVESKLKYAKWKAADIAKALREGRRPTPGPAGSQLESDPLPPSDQLIPVQHPPTPPRPIPREPSPPSSRSPKRHSPPPPTDFVRPAASDPALSSSLAESSPGNSDSLNNWHEHLVDPSTREIAQPSSSKLRSEWVSVDLDSARTDDKLPLEEPALSRGRIHPSTDIPGGSPPRNRPSPPFATQDLSSSPRLADLPPGFVPTSVSSYARSAPFVIPPPPPHVPHSVPTFSVPLPPPVPGLPSAPLPSSITSPLMTDAVLPPPYPPPRETELTPKLVAKAQKHCRHAISALDYDDTQHAIRELKAALETLGVSI